jgi:hypothetical protein
MTVKAAVPSTASNQSLPEGSRVMSGVCAQLAVSARGFVPGACFRPQGVVVRRCCKTALLHLQLSGGTIAREGVSVRWADLQSAREIVCQARLCDC